MEKKRKLLPLSSMIYSNIKELIYIECNNQYYELILILKKLYLNSLHPKDLIQ